MTNEALKLECPACHSAKGVRCIEGGVEKVEPHLDRVEAVRAAAVKLQFLTTYAMHFAAQAHVGQKDKSGVAYILHPLAVYDAVRGQGRVAAIVALLHDTVEDTKVTIADIRREFGDEIAEGVIAVSRGYINRSTGELTVDPPTIETAHLFEKETYRKFIERAKRHSIGRIVKIADIEHNSLPERTTGLAESERGMVEARFTPALKFLRDRTATEFATKKGGR